MNASLSLHPVNLAAALAAAEAFRLEVAGVDMISTDISVPWTENGAAINEVNGGPLLGGAAIVASVMCGVS
jgi:cyanophycin synthetase